MWTRAATTRLRAAERAGVLDRIADPTGGRDTWEAVLASLTEPQRALVRATGQRRVLCCTRRGGKTHGLVGDMLLRAKDTPRGLGLYLQLTTEDARSQWWQAVHDIEESGAVRLGLKEWTKNGRSYCVLPNGARIHLAGCPVYAHASRFRGYKYSIGATIDEAQNFASRTLQYLMAEAIGPALKIRGGGAPLTLAGTPGPVPRGPFYEATRHWPVSQFWTLKDNPHLWDADTQEGIDAEFTAWLKEGFLDPLRLTIDAPRIRREFFGEWLSDTGSRPFPWEAGNLIYSSQVPQGWQYALGIDLGTVSQTDDPGSGLTAFAVLAYQPGAGEVYIVEARYVRNSTIAQTYAEAMRLRQRYGITRATAIDPGGHGAAIIEHLESRYQLPCVPWERKDKWGHVRAFGSELQSGRVRIVRQDCAELLDEWDQLVWDERGRWRDGVPDHCSDAVVGAWRMLPSHYRPEEEPPAPGSPEWDQQRVDERRRQLMRDAARPRRRH